MCAATCLSNTFRYSFSADIWSLGITIIECITGQFPFVKDDGTNPISGFWELLKHITQKDPVQLKGVSAELADFVRLWYERVTTLLTSIISTAKKPADRATASQLLV